MVTRQERESLEARPLLYLDHSLLDCLCFHFSVVSVLVLNGFKVGVTGYVYTDNGMIINLF